MSPELPIQLRHTRGTAVLFLMAAFRSFFVHANRIHLLGGGPANLREVVSVIDRFLDAPRRYRTEWDDFIAWENDNAAVEQVRKRIKAFEHLPASHDLLTGRLISERNRVAVLLGLPAR